MWVRLRDLAHARAGDKGDISNVSLVVYDRRDYELVKREATAERVKAWFGALVKGEVHRFEIPQLGAFNFVMRDALGGGVTRTLALDPHGKTRSSLLLEMWIDVPDPCPTAPPDPAGRSASPTPDGEQRSHRTPFVMGMQGVPFKEAVAGPDVELKRRYEG